MTKKQSSTTNNRLIILVLSFVTPLFTTFYAMDQMQTESLTLQKNNVHTNKRIWIKPYNSRAILYSRDNIKSMKLLQVMLEHQKDTHNKENPLNAFMVNARDLTLLKKALHAVRNNIFEQFYYKLAHEDGLTFDQLRYTVGNGNLRRLINAADTTEATTLRSLFASLLFCPDIQKQITPELLNPAIRHLENNVIKKNMLRKGFTLNNGASSVQSAIISPNGKMVIAGFDWNNNNIELWDTLTGNLIVGLKSNPGSVDVLACNAQSTLIACGYSNTHHNLELWNISDLANIKHIPLPSHPKNTSCLAFSPNGTMLVSGCFGIHNNLILWDISDLTHVKKIANLKLHQATVNAVVFSADNKKIISGADGQVNNLVMWDISNLTKIYHKALPDHRTHILHLALSPDNSKLAYSSNDKTVIIADIRDITRIHAKIIPVHKQHVSKIEFSPDGTRLVLGYYSNRNSIVIADISDMHTIHTIEHIDYSNYMNCVAFSPGGNYIFARCTRKTNNILIWTIFTQQERDLLKKLNTLTTAQILTIFQLCNTSFCNKHILSTIPEEMQALLKYLQNN